LHRFRNSPASRLATVVVPYALLSARLEEIPMPHDDPTFPYALVRDYVRKKVRQIVGQAGFTTQDRDDLEQEMACRLLLCWKSFDPHKGPPGALLKTAGSRIVAKLLRAQRARKRDRRLTRSLQVLAPSEDMALVELAQTISQREQDARLRQRSRTDQESAELAQDLHDILARLPPRLQALAELLKEKSRSAAARALELSPAKARLLLRLLRELLGTNMQDYC
jgi:RNA polymerase sigma factor (sigma-70 family)